MKITIIATEPSGDFLGYKLIQSLKKVKNVEISGVGGELMNSEGLDSWVNIEEFNAIGIYEVMIRILKFIKLFKYIERRIREKSPNILITIDSPSFCYRLVNKIQDLRGKIKFVHYVAPTVWAWKAYRSKIFSKSYDQIFTLFDFEPKYFRKYGGKATFVGHPIFHPNGYKFKKKKIISFYPGSRAVEIKQNLKKLKFVINFCTERYKGFKFYVLTFKNTSQLVEDFIDNRNVSVVTNFAKKQEIMKTSFLAIAASGSVTLELIKYYTPMLVFYDTHWLTKLVIKSLVKVKYASLINIVHNKEVVPEFLFEDFNINNLSQAVKSYVESHELRQKQIRYFKKFMKRMLVKNISPSELIAKNLKLI